MKNFISSFPQQLIDAREIGEKCSINPHSKNLHNICLLGLGGSAFGGEVISNYIKGNCKVPFFINRTYDAPAWVGENTLVIVSSYSGNTEETLSAFSQLIDRGAKVVCITSGGKVLEIARERGFDFIVVPTGFPPRTAAGFSIVQQLYILLGLGLIPDFKSDLTEAIELVSNFKDTAECKELATQLKGKIPVLYSSDGFASMAIRWRQQMEENSKNIAFHHVVPEMNHNELVGWMNPKEILDKTKVIFLRSNLDNSRVGIRMDINKTIISKHSGSPIADISSKGKSKLGQLFYLLHFGDWVSFYLALENEVDPNPVEVIDFLKSELKKV